MKNLGRIEMVHGATRITDVAESMFRHKNVAVIVEAPDEIPQMFVLQFDEMHFILPANLSLDDDVAEAYTDEDWDKIACGLQVCGIDIDFESNNVTVDTIEIDLPAPADTVGLVQGHELIIKSDSAEMHIIDLDQAPGA